ncbi:MAG: hypothetical protein OHK0012_23550 [Synechococcales cyanobacterium]
MSSTAIATLVKMMESLPDEFQEKIVEHIRDYIADLEDEKRWQASFKQTQTHLIEAARQAKKEIARGQAQPMNHEQL